MKTEDIIRQLYINHKISHVDDCRVAVEAVLKSGIRAKALRKRGTDEWYMFDREWKMWFEHSVIDVWSANVTMSSILKETKKIIPSDAELVNLIIVQEGGEG